MTPTSPSLDTLRPAGIITRGTAAVIDLAVVGVLMASIFIGWTFVRLMLDPQSFTFHTPAVVMSISALIAISVAYLTLCWATTGRTVGAIMMGIRLISPRKGPMRWPLAALRALWCVLFSVGLFWVIVDRRRRSIQDIFLRTAVVYDWQPSTELVDPHLDTGQ